ncbi:MAG: LPS export ABC transporter periplasmic protein LptC [Hydrogenophaga sp.]|uniref:LPS export ABC transporter periplasmic protein LptC n=1 Tax=Hydrogenophaga sp. TaxID=1904254 RepID=UPI001DCF7F07|nr:LPS export ABC transporter periplasmic protein LptC [Hydrogenophaga sp.]MBX3608828.1 LPS export ABC transporter periplasmic protein LptC [Hydrogenophaga sp.]
MHAEDDFDLIPGLDRSAPPVTATLRRAPWWDRLSIYLPMLLMGLLALGSYWLLRATPSAPEPEPERPVTGEPDYFMRRFSVKSFDVNGNLRAEVLGDEARHHPDDDRVEIDNARLRNLAENGSITSARSQRLTTNDDNTRFVLEGDAVVVREGGTDASGGALPRLEFRGEYLLIELEPHDRISSDQPVLVIREGDRITADRMVYDSQTRLATFNGRVRMQLAPRNAP